MLKVPVLRRFSYLPVLAQALALCAAILVFYYIIKPAILDSWAREYADFLGYSVYCISLLGIIEGYLRATALRQSIIVGQDSLRIKKSSFVPIGWYNRTVDVPYSSLLNVIISKKPLDLSKDMRFFSRLRRGLSPSRIKAAPPREIFYITVLQSPERDDFDLGILDFRVDISNYNNAVEAKDASKIIQAVRQKADLKFVFN